MDNEIILSESSEAPRHTTKLREWWGWFGVMAWLFCMVNGYIELPNGYSDGNIFWGLVLFQILFAVSVMAVSFRFERDPNGLGRLAYFTTPIAIIITATFTLIPQPVGPILFMIAPVFMAPAAVRRAYGILRTASPGRTLFEYMSGVAIAFLLLHIIIDTYEFILTDEAPIIIAFLIFAFFAFLAWLGVSRRIDIAEQNTYTATRRPSKSYLAGIIAIILVAFWLRLMNNFINYAIEQYDDYLFVPVYVILPPITFALCGWWGDKGHEKKSAFAGLILLLATIQFAFFTIMSDTHSAAAIPLVFVNHFIGNYLVYFIITISIVLYNTAKRPVFTASLGLTLYLAARLFNLVAGRLLPDSIKTAGAPLFVSTAITTIAFFFLLYFIYQRQQEKTLAAALYASLRGGENTFMRRADDLTPKSEKQGMADAGLTPEEIEVALLLIEGKTRSEITRQLRIKAADANRQMNSIRSKLIGTTGADPNITTITDRYKLTGRERDMLRCLCRNMTNNAIAAEMFLSDATVKIHVRNLMKKLPVDGRGDVAAWVDTFETESVN